MKKVKPILHGKTFLLKGKLTSERILKGAFKSYRLNGASEEWAAGFRAAVRWCSGIVEVYYGLPESERTET